MASLYTHQDSNIWKTWFLMTIFLVLIIAIGFIFAQAYNSSVILYIAILFSLIMNFTSYWYSDKITIKMAGGKELNKEDHKELWNIVENLSITAGLPMPKLFLISDPAPNAFATGRNKEHAAIAVTEGLLERLDKNELEGVIAHEMAHVGNRDILLQTVVVVLVGFIAIISDIFLRIQIFGGGDNRGKGNAVIMIIALASAILAPVAATLIQLAISRKREFLADATGALLTRYPEGLASALEKISSYKRPLKKAHNATAHLYISNPFGSKAKKGMLKLFMTHPPIEERIKALRGGR